ncbi:MAG: hypothetical protein KGJ59_07390 [Bacteroidota bacterium]|nr:hypothetical protein [Bacteroidota bacterium]
MVTKSFAKQMLLIVVSLLLVFVVNSCKKSSNNPETPTVTPITDDLFPLTIGHQITYSGYLRSIGSDTNITSTGAAYLTTWTIVSNNIQTPIGGTSTLIMDSTTVPTGVANPPVVTVVTPLYVQRSSATGTANFSFLQDIGLFFRTFGIHSSDSLRWILIGKLDAGVANTWKAFDSTWTTSTGNAELEIDGNFVDKEALTVGGQTFTTTYKLTLIEYVKVGGTTVETAPIATMWLVPNIGPVKMILNATVEANGHYREFRSRNF